MDEFDAVSSDAASGSRSHRISRSLHLPTMEELPYEDGEPMESNRHSLQLPLLRDPLQDAWKDRKDFFIGANMGLYYDPVRQGLGKPKKAVFKAPDVFVVQDVKWRERLSYVLWEEKKIPDVIIEILSPKTRKTDRVAKKVAYQDVLRVPQYIWSDPFKNDFKGFELIDGKYRDIEPDAMGMLACKSIGLKLTQWAGTYNDEYADYWLRWATPKGILLPTRLEVVAIERRLKESERKRANDESRRAEHERIRAASEQTLKKAAYNRLELERIRADEERQRADEADKRAARLEALLKQHGIKPGDK